MLEKFIAKWGDKMFEAEMAKIVNRHALCASIVMFLPLFGMGIFAFIIILWSMYARLCERCNTKLTLGNIVVGLFVNILICFVVNTMFAVFPVIGWLGTSFVVYLQFYLSGKAFIETLRAKSGA
jgi:membrane-associated HD superfamily phosphohydrolase